MHKRLLESKWIQTWTMAIHIEEGEWSLDPGPSRLKLVCEVKVSNPHTTHGLIFMFLDYGSKKRVK